MKTLACGLFDLRAHANLYARTYIFVYEDTRGAHTCPCSPALGHIRIKFHMQFNYGTKAFLTSAVWIRLSDSQRLHLNVNVCVFSFEILTANISRVESL